jgi:hypothetical protein
MRDNMQHKKQVVENALREYKNSIPFITEQRKLDVINMLENVYVMCSLFNIKGVDNIKQILLKEQI